MASIQKSSILSLPAYELTAGGYRALVCPGLGGSCLKLTHIATGAQLLRTPASLEAFHRCPYIYGTPFLFPPNRIVNGVCDFEGRHYEFPLNADKGVNHMHGLIADMPLEVTALEAENDTACIEMQFTATEDTPYLTFPHAFRVILTLTLDASGLSHRSEIINDSAANMPTGTGFHTTLNAPFMPGARAEDCVFTLGVGTEWLTNSIALPDGSRQETSPLQEALRGEGIVPCTMKISGLFEKTGPAILRDAVSGHTVEYYTDSALRFWMLYNADGKQGYICPEPQTWVNNCPNLDIPAEETGFMYLEPGKSLVVRTRLCLK